MPDQIQGHAALLVSCLSIIITMSMVYFFTRAEKNRPHDPDEH